MGRMQRRQILTNSFAQKMQASVNYLKTNCSISVLVKEFKIPRSTAWMWINSFPDHVEFGRASISHEGKNSKCSGGCLLQILVLFTLSFKKAVEDVNNMNDTVEESTSETDQVSYV